MTGRLRMIAVLGALVVAVACSHDAPPAPPTPPGAAPPSATPPPPPTVALLDEATPSGAQPRLASDPAQVADDLVADEQTLRDPSTPEAALREAGRRQQAAYRAIGYHPEWDSITRPRIPAELQQIYDLNVDARRQLTSMAEVRDTIPAWHIVAPAPADDLLAYYREAQAASGVGWNHLAAINLIETRLGSVVGPSSAGAQGPMQFLPSTFAAYGDGTDIYSPRDSILAAGRYLAANNFASNPDGAIYRYNNAAAYVRAVNDYAAILAADPAAFAGFYRWEVYLKTADGDLLLPIGYASDTPVPVAEYRVTHPQ